MILSRKRFWILAAIILAIAISARYALVRWQGQSGLNEIQSRGVLRVGMDASFPPFELVTADGDIIGVDADIARAIAADLDVRVEFANIGFDGLYDALTVGRVDMVISGLPIDPFRTRDIAYSENYFNAGQMLATTRTDVQTVADVSGKTVSVEWGSMADLAARKLRDTFDDVTIIPKDDVASVLQTDLFIVDGVTLLSRPDARVVSVLDDTWYAAAVSIENRSLLAAINRTMRRIKENAVPPCGLAIPASEFPHASEVDSCY